MKTLAAMVVPSSGSRAASRRLRMLMSGPAHGNATCGSAAGRDGTPRLTSSPMSATPTTTPPTASRPMAKPPGPVPARSRDSPAVATPARMAAVTKNRRMALARVTYSAG